MSDIAKWALLIAAFATIIIAILTFPFAQYLNTSDLAYALDVIEQYGGNFLYQARGLINLFLFDWARYILTGLIVYLFLGWATKLSVKIVTWAYHWIFK